MLSSDYWSVKAGNKSPSKNTQSRLPYQQQHLNTADSWIWLRAAESNPLADLKKAGKDNKHTHTHRPPYVRPSATHTLPALYHPAHQAQARRSDLYLFLQMFGKGMSISETISVQRLFTDATQSFHSSICWKKGRIENPHQFIIHGEGIFLSGLLYRSLSQHVTLSISPDKCQSKGLSPGFWGIAGGFQRQ